MWNNFFEEVINDFKYSGDSFVEFFKNISINTIIVFIIVIFAIVGLVDKLRGNKHGYGKKFDEGFHAMGPLALSVVGIVALSPVLMTILSPLITPLYEAMGINPAMFPGSLFALDMGGYAMSEQLGQGDYSIINYAGLIVASTMGITICFTIPFSLTVMKKEDHNILALGILIGIITLPIGCIVGGLTMNITDTPVEFGKLMLNTLPVIILSVVVALGLIFLQKATMWVFKIFGKVMTFIIVVAPVIGIFQYLTGIRLPLFHQMVEQNETLGGVPLEIGLLLVGQIAIFLVGAFPMILFINRRLKKPMAAFGRLVGMNAESSTGLVTQLASSIPVLSVIEEMDKRGKLINIAFAVSGAFVLGDALAFAGGVNQQMVFPVIIAKLTGGILAILLAILLLKLNVIKLDVVQKVEVTENNEIIQNEIKSN